MKRKFYSYPFLGLIILLYSNLGYSQANTTLSNLVSPTAVNVDLLPGTTNVRNIGSTAKMWKNLFLDSAIYFTGLRVVTLTPYFGNMAVGVNSLNYTTGTANTTVGYYSMNSNGKGANNTAIGFRASQFNTTGSNNTAAGYFALYNNSSGYSNVAIGIRALQANTTGSNTIAIGDSALYNNNNSYHNVAVGSKALYSNTTGYYNVALGYQALYSNTTSGYNTGLGYQALYATTGGAYDNTGSGFQALYANTSGSRNTANGVWALLNNTTGSNNVASGVYALQVNKTGNDNVAHGFYAGFYTNGNSNVAIGSHALFNNTSGSNLVAIGDSALYAQNGGSGYNTAIGSKSLYSNTTGTYQTALGYQALYNNTASYSNTANGYQAMYSNTTGSYNTGIGLYSLFDNTTGSFNTGIGLDALNSNTSGSNNTALGCYANVNLGTLTNATAIGYNAIATASNQVMLGNTSVTSVKAAGSFVIYSDGRYKKEVKENVPGLEFIKQLRPVTYHYDIHGLNDRIGIKQSTSNKAGGNADASNNRQVQQEEKAINDKEKKLYTGFVAQEVEAAAKKINYDFSGVYKPQGDKDVYGLSYSDFVVPLVKAVQQLSDENDSLRQQNAAILARLDRLEAALKEPSSLTSSLSNAFIGQNTPNPFNGSTVISYNVPQRFVSAQLVVYDAAGKALKQVNIPAQGKGTLKLDAASLASGAYSYSLLVDGKIIDTKKMVLTK